jgi:hypothetical protein
MPPGHRNHAGQRKRAPIEWVPLKASGLLGRRERDGDVFLSSGFAELGHSSRLSWAWPVQSIRLEVLGI